MNLAEFPIALLADFAPKGQKTLYYDGGNGRLTVTGSDAYGLPTARDADVIVALIYLTKQRNDFKDVKVNFSRYELIKLLNWPDKGSSYTRLDQALNRWGGVWLVYDKCWWNNKTKRFVSAKMHILESVVITEPGKNRDGQSQLPLSTFTWNQTFIESCQADNLRQLDLDAYFSLKSAISKRLYRFLGKRFYLQGDWTFDLTEIAFDRVGLSRSYADAGKIKEKLQPAIEELETIGFLQPLKRTDRYSRIDRGHWTIRLSRQSSALAEPPPSTVPQVEASPPPLAAELVKRGVSAKKAQELVAQHSAETITQKIEQFDWEMAQPNPPKKPAGYLVKSILDGYSPDPKFVSAAERQRRKDADQAREREKVEERRRKKEENEHSQAERKAINAYLESLTPQQQAEHDAAAIAAASPDELDLILPGPMKKIGMGILRDKHARTVLEAQGKLTPADA